MGILNKLQKLRCAIALAKEKLPRTSYSQKLTEAKFKGTFLRKRV
jgi:hypothetical protein